MMELKDFRQEKGLSQVEMAATLGVSLSLYTKVESGQRKPSRKFMLALKKAFPTFDMNFFLDTLL